MNARLATTLSIAANVALAAALWFGHARPRAVVPPPRPVRAAAAIPKPEPALVPAPATPSPAPTTTIRWSEIASTNFFAYRDNLRAIGCPEKTVRDIVESEIAAHFARLRRPILDAIQVRFWDAVAKDGKNVLEDANDAFDKLNTERRELLAKLLGNAPENTAETLTVLREGWQRRYAWLPADKQAALIQLEERHWREVRDLQQQIAQRKNRAWTAEDHTRRQQMVDAYQRTRKERLGEFAGEDELRHSNVANWAGNLIGFQPTEAEWRAVAQAQLDAQKASSQSGTQMDLGMMMRYGMLPVGASVQADGTVVLADGTRFKFSPGTTPSSAQPVELQSQINTILGADRYAEYQRAQDVDYEQTLRVTRRLGVADDTATQAWEIQRAASAAAQQLRANTGLDDASRQAALGEVAREADRSLRTALGEAGFTTYREYAGGWMKVLTSGQ